MTISIQKLYFKNKPKATIFKRKFVNTIMFPTKLCKADPLSKLYTSQKTTKKVLAVYSMPIIFLEEVMRVSATALANNYLPK